MLARERAFQSIMTIKGEGGKRLGAKRRALKKDKEKKGCSETKVALAHDGKMNPPFGRFLARQPEACFWATGGPTVRYGPCRRG